MMHSKNYTGNFIFLAMGSCILFSVLGCGLRQRTGGSPIGSSQDQLSGNLPEGVIVGKNHKVLFSSSTVKLVAGEENKVSFTLVTDKLLALDLVGTSVEITYRMPEMPQMGIFKSAPVSGGRGRFDASFDISMGGKWEIKIVLAKENIAIDEAAFVYSVPQ